MRDGKIVVLQVLAGLNLGGAESRIMDITRNLSDTKVSYDFLLHNNNENNDYYEEEAKALGCHIYRVPRFLFYNLFSYKKAMKKFFEAHPEIDIVQGHITSSASIYLPIAKKAGVKVTIAHARSAGVDAGVKGKLTRLLRKNLYKKTDYMWTCSKEAAVSVFGKKNADRAVFIPNAISVDKFVVSDDHSTINGENLEERSRKISEANGLKDKLVIGHIGRFHYAKNHEFLINIFCDIKKKCDNAVLMLVGDGETKKAIESMAQSLGIKDSVIFAGNQKDVAAYYKTFDILVFPSRYEGLPGTIVESQAAGVPALCSDTITKDMAVTDYVEYMSLLESPEKWADKVLEIVKKKDSLSDNPELALKEKGFDIYSQVKMLEERYADIAFKEV